MEDLNARILEELSLAAREMERLLEGFRIEKEEALLAGGLADLQLLRERSRSHHQVRLRELERRVRTLAARVRTDQPGTEEAEEAAVAAGRLGAEILAHLVSAPNRLLRVLRSGGIERLEALESGMGPDPDRS